MSKKIREIRIRYKLKSINGTIMRIKNRIPSKFEEFEKKIDQTIFKLVGEMIEGVRPPVHTSHQCHGCPWHFFFAKIKLTWYTRVDENTFCWF